MADKTVRYAPEFRRQMVALSRSGRTAASLSKEFGPSAMTIGTWIKQAARDVDRPALIGPVLKLVYAAR